MEFRQALDNILMKSPQYYCGEGREMVLHASEGDIVRYGCKDNNFLQWHWGEGRIPTSFFKEYADVFKRGGVNLYFDCVPTDATEDDIVLVENSIDIDLSATKAKVAVKDACAVVGKNLVWAFGSANVIARGACDCIAYDEALVISEDDNAGIELFGNAQHTGKGKAFKSKQ